MPPGVQRTRPEAPCLGHTSPVARIGACVDQRYRGSSVCHDRDSRLSPVCRPAASAGFAILEFWCPASRRWSRARAGLRVQRNAARWRDRAQALVTTLKIWVLERLGSWSAAPAGRYSGDPAMKQIPGSLTSLTTAPPSPAPPRPFQGDQRARAMPAPSPWRGPRPRSRRRP